MSWVWYAYVGLPLVLAALHRRTRGRSSPVAAFAFVAGGPVLGAGLLLWQALADAGRAKRTGSDAFVQKYVYGLSIEAFGQVILAAGLAAAVIAALAYAWTIRDEIPSFKEDRKALPRPAAPPALQALGLTAFASPDDVDEAYRRLARQLHPDVGGDPAKFKRLQRDYERAKRDVARPGRGCRT